MKNLALLLMILAVLTPGAAPVLAQPSAGAFALASYFPDDIDVYIGLRTDDRAIANLDDLLAKISGFAAEFGAEDLPSDARGMFLEIDGVNAADIDAILAWTGDSIAFGTSAAPNQPEKVVWALQLDDRAAAEEFIISRAGNLFESAGTQGDFTVYEGDGYLLFSDDIMLGISAATPDELAALTSGDYPRLTNREGFGSTISSLPDTEYTLGAYVSENVSGEFDMGLDQVQGSVAVGLAVIDGATLAIDVFSPMTGLLAGDPLDPAFTRHIPADASIFFHGSNLGGTVDAGIDEAARNQLRQGLTSVGLDLDSMLEWMSGDFAVFARLDFRMFWQSIMTGVPAGTTMQEIADGIDLGFVIESTDPEASAAFRQALMAQLRALPIDEPGSRVETQEMLAGTDATVFTITAEDGSGITFRLALASNDDVFAIGTYNGVAAALTAEPAGENTPAAEASAFFLPDAIAVWYIDGETLSGTAVVAVIAVLGPQIQNVFDNITDTLNGTAAPSATPTQPPSLMASLDFDRLMTRLSQFLRYATTSISTPEDGTVIRFTLTLGQ